MGESAENDALRAHVEHLGEVIDVLRWTVADLLPSNASQSFFGQLRNCDDSYRRVRDGLEARVVPPERASDE